MRNGDSMSKVVSAIRFAAGVSILVIAAYGIVGEPVMAAFWESNPISEPVVALLVGLLSFSVRFFRDSQKH